MTKLDEVIQLVQTTIHMGKASRFMVLEDIVTKLKSNINTALNEDGWSILHIAVYQHDQLNMLRRNSFSLTFLQNSTSELRENSFKLIELLIECNANVNLLDKYGRPPIFFAASQEVSDFLIKAGADVFFQNLEFSALHVGVLGVKPRNFRIFIVRIRDFL